MIKLLCKGRDIFRVSTEVSLEGNNEGNIEVCMEASSFDCLMSEKTKWRGISTPGPSQSTGSLNQVCTWVYLWGENVFQYETGDFEHI